MFKTTYPFMPLDLILIATGAFLGFKAYDGLQSGRTDQILSKVSSNPPIFESTQPKNYPLSYYQSIIDRNLFNTRSESKMPSSPLDPDTLPQTGLELKLWGTAAGDEETSYAVIQDTKQVGRKRQHMLYKPGDLIRNAKLAKIYRDKVVLKIDGKNEVLKLEQFRSRPTRAQRPKGLRTRVVRRAIIKKAVNISKRLPASDQFQQHQEGIYLNRINRNLALRRLGLRNKDLITAINGQPAHSVNEIDKIYDLIQSSRRFNLELRRRGRPTTIKYFIR